jgi:hypothetical protein
MVAVRRIFLGILVSAATSWLFVLSASNGVDRKVHMLFSVMLVFVLLSLLIDYFIVERVHVVLKVQLKLKLWVNLCWQS